MSWFGSNSGGVATLDWPSPEDDWDFSDDLAVTPHDVRTVLGPDADDLMAEAQVDVDELIRLINAETTLLPALALPDEMSADRAPKAAEEPERALVSAVRTWKRRFLRGSVLALLISLSGGGAAALAMNKSVTVDVDGQQRTVHSFGDTVGEVLEDAGVTVGEHDSLSPSPQAAVGDGGVIKLERGRHLSLIVDGVQRESWVRATNLNDALDQLGLSGEFKSGTWFSVPGNAELPLEGATVEVKTLKNITLYDGDKEPRQVSSTAVTAKEFLGEQQLTLGPDDAVEGGLDVKVLDGAEVHVSRTGVSVINQEEDIDPPVQEVEDANLEKGKEVVDNPGTPGKKVVTYRVTKKNGKETGRVEVSAKVVTEAVPKVIRIGTKKPVDPAITGGAVWDALAKCEAGGNWAINTGNGYYGGLQFDKSTWNAYGGDEYAAYPHQASRAQQIAIATKVRDARGGSYSAWPACSAKLGLD